MLNTVGKDLSQWFDVEPHVSTAACAGVALGRMYPSVVFVHYRHQGRQVAWGTAFFSQFFGGSRIPSVRDDSLVTNQFSETTARGFPMSKSAPEPAAKAPVDRKQHAENGYA